jgi:formylglycine-generating enzyme required for sulfatase activity
MTARIVEIDWILVPAGEFLTGSDRTSDRRTWGNEEPQHLLYLEAFCISKTPITNEQYLRFIDVTGHHVPEDWVTGKIPTAKEAHPVVFVDWYDSLSFCSWVGGRLPTEAEWEKAARGVDGRFYPWGNARPNRTLCNHNFFFGDTLPVGSHSSGASPYGVLDMAGNIWEWTASKPAPYPYNSTDGRESAKGDEYRVLRGGAFRTVNPPRCAFRDVGTPPTQATNFRGIRAARSV